MGSVNNDEQRVRIRITLDGTPQWMVRVEPDGVTRVDKNPNLAALLSRDVAREQCKRLRAKDPLTPIEIVSSSGIVLFAEETKPSPPDGEPDRRVPVFDQDTLIRIVPGAANTWWIRFPNSPYESIRGNSPEECFDKFLHHPWHGVMEPKAERYVPPAIPPVDPREIIRQIEREQMNGRRMRIGDRQ